MHYDGGGIRGSADDRRGRKSGAMLHESYILLVDDNADLRNSLERLLTMRGYVVQAAGDGCKALASMKRNKLPPILVITDLSMPNCDGRELRKNMLDDPELAAVPVVVMSAITLSPPRRDLDAVAYLEKPFSLASLLKVIDDHIMPDR